MSIPPLVCSTPPPPDQCEDDKDPEDFDLSYRLSQDEDEEDDAYNYGSFSTFNSFQSSDKKEQNLPQTVSEIKKEIEYDNNKTTQEYNISLNDAIETDNIGEVKLKCEEDTNIEDLNLELNDEIVTNEMEAESEESETQGHNIDSLKEAHSIASATQNSDNTDSLCYDDPAIDSLESDKEKDSHEENVIGKQLIKDNIFEANVDTGKNISEEINASAIEFEELVVTSKIECSTELAEPPTILAAPPEETIIDDDFGDFEDFQFVSPENKIADVVNECDNPWHNKDTNPSDFGSFTATFEESPIQTDSARDIEVPKNYSNDNHTQKEDNDVEDDDFGDFDDFKSSTVTNEVTENIQEHSTPCQDVPVLNLQSNDSEQQIMESISKVLTSIFLEEMTEPDSQFEGKLESLLSETWGHLMETDERQPYIVNWNNSFGQKTLLQALCIDSRNILFGPKWNTNMPKYAANLSVAPLQPQKPLTPSQANMSHCEISDKSSKPATWTDPFTSDGQESCNTESANRATTGPTDLDVFEGAMQAKSEKIYSSTLSVQPLRQINLPDTHIFTPTDSETPRSKTIHYDSSPTVLMPQPVMPDSKKEADSISNQNTSEMVANSKEDDGEYWEFQDFKSTSDTKTLPDVVNEHSIPLEKNTSVGSDSPSQKSDPVFQTQPLQPIKVEPTMPTLNWPEPGDVKGVFDDFSGFVSISSQNTEQSLMPDPLITESSKTSGSGNLNDLNIKTEKASTDKSGPTSGDFDDDFNTFQSALPTTTSEFSSKALDDLPNQISSSKSLDFEYAFPKTNVKSDTISFPSVTRPNEALSQIIGQNSNTNETIKKSSLHSGTQLLMNVLQPTSAFSGVNTHNQQNSGQILQPLSLEGYSQINWPSPGIDLQDLSRFNPVETLQSLKSDLSVGGLSKNSSPVHSQKSNVNHQTADDEAWGDFVSSKPKQPSQPKKPPVFVDDDEWTDFISSPSVKPQNGLNTISLNVHTSSNQKSAMQKLSMKTNQAPLDIPTLNYITPKSSNQKSYNDRHFQNL